MGCINLNKKQAEMVAILIANLLEGNEVWLHGELESVFVEINDSEGKTVVQHRVFENGVVFEIPCE